ncbi:type II toxin-antitoxin system HicB family antitoxin [Campylobacter showae]|jgi:hypothetical protein|uniref:type II toxin-antitoxin system HicB family antitoxin n=1 Tax=Campylobacter showae TaxID=204 RepID=UPI000F073087|nr:type II toxin-antitoxin system HicB family antitoxin [Campylobacter showae]
MKKDVEYYMNLPYEIIVKKLSKDEGGGYLARYKDYPLVMGDGENEAEAIADVKKAFRFVIETDLKEGVKIIEPGDDTKFKRINITMPESIINAIDKITNNRSAWLSDTARRALSL